MKNQKTLVALASRSDDSARLDDPAESERRLALEAPRRRAEVHERPARPARPSPPRIWSARLGISLAALLVSSGAVPAQAPFDPYPSWVSGPTNPTLSCAFGDVDRDGDLDLVTGGTTGSVQLHRNDGGRLSTLASWTAPPEKASSIALGDIDGDGLLDLVLGNSYDQDSMYRGDGVAFESDPVWQAAQAWGTNEIALADVDDDGDLDLVSSRGVKVFVYTNEGGALTEDYTWQSPFNYDNVTLAVADIDRDGLLDLVCGNDSEPNTLYLNTGAGFPSQPDWTSGTATATSSVAVGDIDGDGDFDLVCANRREFFVYDNDGGMFTSDPVWSADTTYLNYWYKTITLGDVDGDEDLDLACAQYNGENLIYLNEAGVFGNAPGWTSDLVQDTYACAFGDVDGDGDLDLACGNSDGSDVVYMNSSAPFPTEATWLTSPVKSALSVALGDVDMDGDFDLACGNQSLRNTLYRNDDGQFGFSPVWSSYPVNSTYSVALADVDGDLDLDLLCGNWDAPNEYYRNDSGQLETTPAWTSSLSNDTFGIALGDLDGDGSLDLVCANRDGSSPTTAGQNTVYLNRDGLFEPHWTSTRSALSWAVALGDIDRDGDLDLVFGNQDSSGDPGYNTVYYNAGGEFPPDPSWTTGPTHNTTAIALGDIDGDEDLDLVCGNVVGQAPNGNNTLYLNEGSELNPTPAWSSLPSSNTRAVALGDVDGDGDLDLVCGNYGGFGRENRLYRNDGGTLAPSPAWASEIAETWAVTLGDVDADGDLDLVCGSHTGDGAALYPGLGAPPYKGQATNPTHQLPNNAAFLRHARLERLSENRARIHFRAVDIESDRVWIVPEFQFEGAPVWYPVATPQGPLPVGPLDASAVGIEHWVDWDLSRLPLDGRNVIVRLRTVSNPSKAGLIRNVATYLLPVGPIQPRRPEILSVSEITFSTVTLGDSVDVPMQISNVGNDVLTVTDLALPSLEIVAQQSLPFDVPAGESRVVTLTLAPRSELSVSGDVVISSNDPITSALSVPVHADIRDLTVETNALADEEEAALGQALTIQVIPGDAVIVEDGTLFHRPAIGGGDFTAVPLVPSGGSWIGVVPNEAVTERNIEFFVEVENSGITRTDPPGAPVDSLLFQAVKPPSQIQSVPRAGSGGRFLSGQDVPVYVQFDEGTVFVEGALHYRRAGERNYESTPLAVTESGPLASIPATFVQERGVDYWIEVKTEVRRDPPLTDPPSNPETAPRTIRTSVLSVQEPLETPGQRYRMLSLPMVFDPEFQGTVTDILVDEGEFGLADPTKWRAFRFLPPGETVELADDSRFRPIPGRAFWLISRSNHRVDSAPIEALSTPSDSAFELVLEPGWNQFGHPFAFPVAWGGVVISSSDVGDPVAFDPTIGTSGDYSDSTVVALLPFQGYFIHNHSSQAQTLRIPTVETGTVARVRGEAAPTAWQLRLTATTSTANSGGVTLGTHAEALDDFDHLDRERPPAAPGPWISLAVANRDWSRCPGLYRRDLRGAQADGHTWNIEVLTQKDGEDVLVAGRWDPPPTDDLALRLVDLEQGVSLDMLDSGEIGHYRIVSSGPERPYRLAILAGTADYVEREGGALIDLPVSLTLDRNAPNPFRHATRIRFGLPEPTLVSLTVFNLEGRRVGRLVDHRLLPAGFHTSVWDGRDGSGRRVSSGVYFYRLEAGDAIKGRKMLVLR